MSAVDTKRESNIDSPGDFTIESATVSATPRSRAASSTPSVNFDLTNSTIVNNTSSGAGGGIATICFRGLAPSTVDNATLPLRVIFKRAVERDELADDPTQKLDLPRDRSRRERIAPPREIQALIEVLPPQYRALWTTVVYSGLRRGELQALRWSNVDLKAGSSWSRPAGTGSWD